MTVAQVTEEVQKALPLESRVRLSAQGKRRMLERFHRRKGKIMGYRPAQTTLHGEAALTHCVVLWEDGKEQELHWRMLEAVKRDYPATRKTSGA